MACRPNEQPTFQPNVFSCVISNSYSITNNNISVKSAQSFLEVLKTKNPLRVIEYVKFSGCTFILSLCAVNSGMVIDELRGTEQTKKAYLSRKSLGDFDAVLLAEWIKDNNTLETLE